MTCPAFWHNSNRLFDWLLGGKVLRRVAVAQLTDSLVVAAQATGSWAATCAYTQFLRWSHHCLRCLFDDQGIQWIERAQNGAADLLADAAHSHGTSDLEVVPVDLTGVRRVTLTSDGSSRGGMATCAACIWLETNEGTTLAAWQRVRLGLMDSLQAEYEGACLAIQILVRWSWVVGIIGEDKWT
jgi:hypothetical protein